MCLMDTALEIRAYKLTQSAPNHIIIITGAFEYTTK